jgi:glyoxylase-like metal-dependent hydrolase (beta-lactamase superfamily II)
MGTVMGRRSLLRAGVGLAGSGALGVAGSRPVPARPVPDRERGQTSVAVGLVTGPPTVTGDGGPVRVALPVLGRGGTTTVHTQPVSAAVADVIAGSVREGALVDFLTAGGEVVVAAEPGETFHTALVTGPSPVFVTQKYGPDLAPRGGVPGAMVAAGWVHAKGSGTITVGDGAGRPKPGTRYEETYRLAEDVEVYAVDTRDWGASARSTFDAVPVTRDPAAGTSPQAVFVVFDRDFRQAAQARVRQIYYFTRWDRAAATGVREAPHTHSTEPFEIVPGTLYCVGDDEVSLYLFRCDTAAGTRLLLVDTGWPNSGYQYWKNIEAVGLDPRDIDVVLLPGGHLRDYGTTAELVTMIENAGGAVELIVPREDLLGTQTNAEGQTWRVPPDLSREQEFLRARTRSFELDRWMDFGNVRIRPLWTPGHTAGTTSYVFEVAHGGRRLTFGYLGGYGWRSGPTAPANGWRGLGFAYRTAQLQQSVDVDYIIGQHASQWPVVEIHRTLEAYNSDPANRGRPLTVLDALTRREWADDPTRRYRVASRGIEALGPFDRVPDTPDLRVRVAGSGRVLRRVEAGQDPDTRVPLLKDGTVLAVDSFVQDRPGWYVQFELTGLDDIGGDLPELGPAESTTPEVTTVLRTQRLGTRAEADALVRAVQPGQTYRVDLALDSAITIPVDGSPAFRPGN